MHRARSLLTASIAIALALGATNARAAEEDEPVTSSGIMLGATVGYLASAPNLEGGPAAGSGPALGVNVGYRFRSVYAGAAYSHGFLAGNGESGHESTTWFASSASSDYVGFDIDWISDPDGPISFVTHFSAGYRLMTVTSTASYDPAPTTTSSGGLDVMLVGIGLQVNVKGWLRLQPVASVSAGPGLYGSLGLTAFFDLGAPKLDSDTPSPSSSSSSPSPPAKGTEPEPTAQPDPRRSPDLDRWDRAAHH